MKINRTSFYWVLFGVLIVTVFVRLQPSRQWKITPRAAVESTGRTFSDNFFLATSVTDTSRPSPANELTLRCFPDDPTNAVHGIFEQWSATKTGEVDRQDQLTNEALALLTENNTAGIVGSLSPEELNTPLGARLLEHWLGFDAPQAARWLAARSDATPEQAWLVARGSWRNAEELLAYCNGLAETEWKQAVLHRVSLEMAEENPAAAIGLARNISSPEEQASALETIAYAWYGRDFDGASNWAKITTDVRLRERLLAIGAKAIALQDPDLAAGWLANTVTKEGVPNDTAISIVDAWAATNPGAAANWVERFSVAGPRMPAISLVLNHWLQVDATAANAWIATLPEHQAILAAAAQARESERERSLAAD